MSEFLDMFTHYKYRENFQKTTMQYTLDQQKKVVRLLVLV